MIATEEQLKQTQEQLAILKEDLEDLRKEVFPINPARFHLMAEAYERQIGDLQKEIDDYEEKGGRVHVHD